MAKPSTLEYKGHPLMRNGNIIYYGSMDDDYIIMMQILDTQKVQDMEVATKVSIQLQLTDTSVRAKDRIVKASNRKGLVNQCTRKLSLPVWYLPFWQ